MPGLFYSKGRNGRRGCLGRFFQKEETRGEDAWTTPPKRLDYPTKKHRPTQGAAQGIAPRCVQPFSLFTYVKHDFSLKNKYLCAGLGRRAPTALQTGAGHARTRKSSSHTYTQHESNLFQDSTEEHHRHREHQAPERRRHRETLLALRWSRGTDGGGPRRALRWTTTRDGDPLEHQCGGNHPEHGHHRCDTHRGVLPRAG